MNASGIKAGDIIRCDVRGDRFYGEVVRGVHRDERLKRRIVQVVSLTGRPIPAHMVTPRQIVTHWRLSRQSKTTNE